MAGSTVRRMPSDSTGLYEVSFAKKLGAGETKLHYIEAADQVLDRPAGGWATCALCIQTPSAALSWHQAWLDGSIPWAPTAAYLTADLRYVGDMSIR